MNEFFNILYSLLWIWAFITVLSIKQFFQAIKRTVAPTLSEYFNMLLLHIILSGLIWGCTDRTLTSLFISTSLCLYLTFFISTQILIRIRYIHYLEQEIEKIKK